MNKTGIFISIPDETRLNNCIIWLYDHIRKQGPISGISEERKDPAKKTKGENPILYSIFRVLPSFTEDFCIRFLPAVRRG